MLNYHTAAEYVGYNCKYKIFLENSEFLLYNLNNTICRWRLSGNIKIL